MNWFREKLQEWRRVRATLALVRAYHANSRLGRQRGQRARLISVRGVRFDVPK
jgi:hypothetical protein